MAGIIPIKEQVAMIEDETNSAFLPSLRFFELNEDNLWEYFKTPDERLALINQLKQRASANDCDAFINEIFPDYNSTTDSDQYIRNCLNELVYTDIHNQIIETTHIHIAYDLPIDNIPNVIPGAGIVGFIATTLPYNRRAIFFYPEPVKGEYLHAVASYINWTCSFTTIPEIYNLLKYKLQLFPGRKLSIGAFLLYNLTRAMIQYINRNINIRINLLILYSEGIPSARRAHRKVGKRSACTFLEQWISIEETDKDILGIFMGEPNPNHMIYTYMPLKGIYQIFPADMEMKPDLDVYKFFSGSALRNQSYFCPSGVPAFEGGRRKTRRKRRH